MACCTSEQLSLIARALSDPIRCQILELIARGDTEDATDCCTTGMCVCDIQEVLDLKQSKVSYHLKELKNAGLLYERKQGKWKYYSVNQAMLRTFCDELSHRFHLTDELVTPCKG
ncbi:ArsR family transcriptional regulator [Melghirimyces thermohalophilus]|mgnify:CR=1 FL=1|uniref:ArsR family transcriptional regulator n=1 Tax=Melghirimyces thermohalophilus TaxID=1236220 RepID=A0A1G6ICM4_9BACL|nr:metalloregulator ArsR/SmtB family transcription factor [Melghirimyces thermohalophilus]SDC04292.1 ArsR family transcriptional regulator [Melghirimyces thermohalophilus]